jgi:hypothetical protein
VPLSVQSGDVTYRFVGTINIRRGSAGSIAKTIQSDLNSPSTELVSLLPGEYTLEVVEGYSCSVEPSDPTFTGCTYVEGSSSTFKIKPGRTTEIPLSFVFHFDKNVDVVFAQGSANISLVPERDEACGGPCAENELCISIDGAEPACAVSCATSDDCDLGQYCAFSEGGSAVCLRQSYDHELTTAFTVDAGVEDRRCTVIDVGNTSPVKIGEVDVTTSPAVYDVTLWAVDRAPGASDCSELADASTRRLLLSKSDHERLTFPEGIGYSFAAHQSLLIEAHLLNNTDTTASAEVTLGLETMPAENFEREAGLLLVENLDIEIPPGEAVPANYSTQFRHSIGAALDGGSIFRVQGYTHALGTGVLIQIAPATDAWAFAFAPSPFDPENPPAFPLDPAITLTSTGELSFVCAFTNPNPEVVSMGTSASDERCVALIYYAGAAAEQTCLGLGSTLVCCSSGTCP